MTIPPGELAKILVSEFDRKSAISLDRAIIKILRARGLKMHQAEETAYGISNAVLRHLRSYAAEELPFKLCDDGRNLVGKARASSRDNEVTSSARTAEGLAEDLLNHLTTITPDEFEVVSAAALLLAGAREMHALCTGDEGGVDCYGRLEIRPRSHLVPEGIIHTTILPKELLVLGQAKRYGRDYPIGRPEIQKFKAQIADCLDKYEGNARPPSHRVPESYYHRREPHLGVFITTATFTETARECIEASGIVLVTGIQLAQFLAFHGVGIVQSDRQYQFSVAKFTEWLNLQSSGICKN